MMNRRTILRFLGLAPIAAPLAAVTVDDLAGVTAVASPADIIQFLVSPGITVTCCYGVDLAASS